MDENKEKELLGEETEEKLTEQEKEEVAEILENLENQQEAQATTDWDGLAQIGDDNTIIDEDVAEEEPDETEIAEDMLCEKCGKRERYTELDEDYPYCKACREKMKKTRMNGWGVFFFVSVLLGCIGYIFYSVAFLAVTAPVIKGDMYMAEGKYNSAIACYEETIGTISQLNQSSGGVEIFDAGDRTYAKIIKAYFLAGTPTYAQDYYAALESSGALDKAGYKETKEYYEIYDKMMTTYSNLQKVYVSKLNSLYAAEEKADISAVTDELKELEGLKANSENDRYMVAYFQYLFCSLTENSTDEAIKYLEEIKAGGKAYEETSNILLCVLYLNTKQYDKVEKICTEAVATAPESIDYYQYLMKVRIKQNNPQGALDIYNNVVTAVNSIYSPADPETGLRETLPIPYTFLAEKAAAHALLGDADAAIEAIDQSYALGVDIHTANVYALLHYMYHVKGNEPVYEDDLKIEDAVDNGYDAILTVFAGSNAQLNADVKAAIEGKKTLKEVFVDGEAYLQ